MRRSSGLLIFVFRESFFYKQTAYLGEIIRKLVIYDPLHLYAEHLGSSLAEISAKRL